MPVLSCWATPREQEAEGAPTHKPHPPRAWRREDSACALLSRLPRSALVSLGANQSAGRCVAEVRSRRDRDAMAAGSAVLLTRALEALGEGTAAEGKWERAQSRVCGLAGRPPGGSHSQCVAPMRACSSGSGAACFRGALGNLALLQRLTGGPSCWEEVRTGSLSRLR